MARKPRSHRPKGVTITEILVGLVALGILVAAAIPAHRGYVIRVNRSDARRDLVALAGQLQRCFERSGDFRVEASGSPRPCVKLPAPNAEGTYLISFAGQPTAGSFRLLAQPRGAQAADLRCGGLTLDERGERGVTGSGAATPCWQGPG